MSKKPVIKQKLSKPRSKRRFATWVKKIQTKLVNRVNLVDCAKCGEKKISHTVCQVCGDYKGKTVLKMKEVKLKKTTRVAA